MVFLKNWDLSLVVLIRKCSTMSTAATRCAAFLWSSIYCFSAFGTSLCSVFLLGSLRPRVLKMNVPLSFLMTYNVFSPVNSFTVRLSLFKQKTITPGLSRENSYFDNRLTHYYSSTWLRVFANSQTRTHSWPSEGGVDFMVISKCLAGFEPRSLSSQGGGQKGQKSDQPRYFRYFLGLLLFC